MPVKKKPTTREYHVYDARVVDIANKPIADDGNGVRTIHLTQGEAQYLIEQGTIGITPLAQLSDEAFDAYSQMKRSFKD